MSDIRCAVKLLIKALEDVDRWSTSSEVYCNDVVKDGLVTCATHKTTGQVLRLHRMGSYYMEDSWMAQAEHNSVLDALIKTVCTINKRKRDEQEAENVQQWLEWYSNYSAEEEK